MEPREVESHTDVASNPDDFKAASEREVSLSRGLSVTIGCVDLLTLFMEGVFPMPLVAAVERLVNQVPTFVRDPTNFAQVPPEERQQLLEAMRIYACAVVKQPTFVLKADADPAHVPVTTLQSHDLLAIWVAGHTWMGTGGGLTEATADRFRGAGAAAHERPPQGRHDVRPAAECVAAAAGADVLAR